MSVIDLSTRICNDWNTYNNNKRSSDSYIYIDDEINLEDGPSSIDLSVGDNWYQSNEEKPYLITDEGIQLAPFQSILLEVKQEIANPYNVFGLVTGKGLKIFEGVFISTGKINPGYIGKLKIGIYNGSKKKIIFKKNMPLCTCVFFAMESNLQIPLKNRADNSNTNAKPIGKGKYVKNRIKENKEFLAILISIIALLASIANVVLNRNFIFYDKQNVENSKVTKRINNDNSK